MTMDTAVADKAAPAPVQPPASIAGTPPPASTDWTKDLAPELKSVIETKGYKSPADLATAYVNAERAIGADKIVVPKDGKWTPEDLKKLGVPATAAEYQLKRPESLPQGLTYDENFEKAAVPVLHQLGIPPAGAQALLDMYVAHQTQLHTAAATARTQEAEATTTALKAEWGPQYDARVAQAQRAAQHFGGQPFVDFLNQSGAGNNPEFIRAFSKIGALIAEDTLKTGVTPGAMSKEMAQAEVNKIMADPNYTNRDAPNQKDLVRKVAELNAIIYPAPAA